MKISNLLKKKSESWNGFQESYTCTNWRNKVGGLLLFPSQRNKEKDQSFPLLGFSGLTVAVYHQLIFNELNKDQTASKGKIARKQTYRQGMLPN